MRITYIANIRIPTEKAHGIQIMKMCEAFANAGNEVNLVVPRRLNNINEDAFEYYDVKENFEITKLPILDLIMFGKIGFWIQSFIFAKFATIYSLFKKADIIYSRDELPVYFLSFFKRNLVLEVHVAKKNFISERVFRKSLKIIAITRGLIDFYIKKYGTSKNKILWVPDAVDLKEFSALPDKEKCRNVYHLPLDKKIIGYVGKFKTMGKSKGIGLLIKAFPEILKKEKSAFLLLVGVDKRELPEIENLFVKLGIDKSCYKIITHLPRKEAFYYLKASDVLLMNYPNIEHYALYMSPMKLFEYMASGNPIVSSSLPSVKEILNEKNSILINSDDSNKISEAAISLLENKSLSEKISKQAYIDVQEYTWDKRIKKIIDFIK